MVRVRDVVPAATRYFSLIIKDLCHLIYTCGTGQVNTCTSGGAGRGNPAVFGAYANSARNGQRVGDAISVVQGLAEMTLALAGLAGEGALALVSGGASALAIAPTVAVGAHGTMTATTGFQNLVKASSGDDDPLNGGKRLPDEDLVSKPKERGKAPVGKDGKPVELHHKGQKQDSPLDEMTFTDHRGKGNYKTNHTNTGKTKSEIDRGKFDKQREQHWKKEWDKGRFDNLPDQE